MTSRQPNILFIMSDDHAAHAMSCYGSNVNSTPNLDRLAREGVRFDNVFCTNAICTPSRATVLTGQYSHRNKVYTLEDKLERTAATFPKLLRQAGYQTAIIGKWHLGHGEKYDPDGFDHWEILPEQGVYHNPTFLTEQGSQVRDGYVTDLITDLSLEWLTHRDPSRPFLLLCHHKAVHSPFDPDDAHATMFADADVPEPSTLRDDFATRPVAEAASGMRISYMPTRAVKQQAPQGLSDEEVKTWRYQAFIKDYLRCVAAIDDNVGRMLDYLDEQGLSENTIVVYTSDQGFFLGDHGWYDKRFMYEESLRMPLLVRYPATVGAGSVVSHIVTNVDFAPTFLDYGECEVYAGFQGTSLRPLLEEGDDACWNQTSMYYRYWMNLAHHDVPAHYGIRTKRHKLVHYYTQALGKSGAVAETRPAQWELFDLADDPVELRNLYYDPDYGEVRNRLTAELEALRERVGDQE